MRHIKGGMTTLGALVAVIAVGVVNAPAHASSEGTVLKFSDWVKEVAIKGDFRLRHESQHRSNQHNSATNATLNTSSRDRHRQRLRLRLGLDFKLPSNVEAKFQFASGTGEQVSTNQSLDNLSGEKDFWIDRAYLQWKPKDSLRLAAGKMNNPLWTLYSSDILWDSDFNPEGAAQSMDIFGLPRTKVFLHAMQMVVDEDSAGTQDQAEFSQQIGAEMLVFTESKLTIGVGLHEWVNESDPVNSATLSAPAVQEGNTRVGATAALAREFRVTEYTGEYKTALFNLPLSFQGTYIHNTGKVNIATTTNADSGFQYGVIIGKASKAKTMELGLFYKRVETDATVADVADSDFGTSGGTNRKGFIGWIGFAPTNWSLLQVKHFVTKTLDDRLAPFVKPANRTQVDFSVKF